MQTTVDDDGRLRELIDTYARGVVDADADVVRSVFSHDAYMWGWLGDDFVSAPISGFVEIVRQTTSDPGRVTGYAHRVVEVTRRSRMAVVIFEESGFLGRDFTNTFTFIKREGDWKAVSKTFTSPAQ